MKEYPINLLSCPLKARQIFMCYQRNISNIVAPIWDPGNSVVKNPPANAGDAGSTSGSGRSPGEGNDN